MTVQQVVEVMRHAAGELTNRFHLLGLSQRRFGAQPLGGFTGDALFQCFVEMIEFVGAPQDGLGASPPAPWWIWFHLVYPGIGAVRRIHPRVPGPPPRQRSATRP